MTQCSHCISNNEFNFSLNYKDTYLEFKDLSEWVKRSESTTPITLTISNDDISKDFSFYPNDTILIKYCELPSSSASCGEDGIYEFKVINCGETYIVFEAIIKSLMCAYQKILIQYPEKKDLIIDLFLELEFIKANANAQFPLEAKRHYKLAKNIIETLNCKC